MSADVFCKRYNQNLPALAFAPLPGEKGKWIKDNISQKAWQEWLDKQTMLINEKQLSLIDKEDRQYLTEQMEKFFNNETTDEIEGFVAPTKNP